MHNINLETLMDRIYCAETDELDPILNAVIERFSEIHPGWELMAVTVQGHKTKDRIAALKSSIALLSHDAKNDLP